MDYLAVGIVVGLLALAFLIYWIAYRRAMRRPAPDQTAASAPQPGTRTHGLQYGDPTMVTRVIDGDTFCIHIWTDIINPRTGTYFTKEQPVRVIGIDTPETVHPEKPAEYFGPQASAEAKRVLTDSAVRLAHDPTQQKRDQYGRLLCYVQLPDGTDYGEHMIASGHATEYSWAGRFYFYQHRYLAAEFEARQGRRGMWRRR